MLPLHVFFNLSLSLMSRILNRFIESKVTQWYLSNPKKVIGTCATIGAAGGAGFAGYTNEELIPCTLIGTLGGVVGSFAPFLVVPAVAVGIPYQVGKFVRRKDPTTSLMI
jgi:uncharacterized membrane protein